MKNHGIYKGGESGNLKGGWESGNLKRGESENLKGGWGRIRI